MEQEIKKILDTIIYTGQKLPVLVVAATKTIDERKINELKDYGIVDAGENRVQELIKKYDSVSGIRWHFIGNLQKNKVKYIIDKVCLIHSVDSFSLAEQINNQAKKIGKIQNILIEVNIGREESKGGVYEENLADLVKKIMGFSNISLRGLMSVMPKDCGTDLYKKMKCLYDEACTLVNSYKKNIYVKNKNTLIKSNTSKKNLEDRKESADKSFKISDLYQDSIRCFDLGQEKLHSFDFLSVGMSGDYDIAIKYGANIIRPGSAIFGKREY